MPSQPFPAPLPYSLKARITTLGGDFNATQQSAELGELRAAGLTSALDEAGWGRCSTWPQESPLSIFPGIRIDQLMYRGLVCESAKVAAPTGSDHLPFVARFRLEPAAPHK